MKRGILLFILVVALVNLSMVYAADCGGDVQCQCGDTLVESQVMWYDLEDCGWDGVNIGASDITLDCNGHFMEGDGWGIEIREEDNNIVIKNCEILDFSKGIYLNSKNNLIENNTFQNLIQGVVMGQDSEFNIIKENKFKNNSDEGFSCSWINGDTLVENNLFEYNGYGIHVQLCPRVNVNNNTFQYNSMAVRYINNGASGSITNNGFFSNGVGVELWEAQLIIFGNIFVNNGISATLMHTNWGSQWNNSEIGNIWDDFETNPGYPDYYIIEDEGYIGDDGYDYKAEQYIFTECGETITEDTVLRNSLFDCPGNGLIIGADNIVFDCNGLIISGDGNGQGNNYGVYLYQNENVTIKNCNIQNFFYGIGTMFSDNNLITGNNISFNINDGITVSHSNNNTLNFNNFINNFDGGVEIASSSNDNYIAGNNIGNNYFGIISVQGGQNNEIYNNNIFSNSVYGVYVYQSSQNNTFWKNNFINNNINAFEEMEINNFWNNSEIGNYWSDFETNPGYPNYYEISGPGDGIDWFPNGPIGSEVNPDYSYIVLTNGNYNGLVTCPAGDGIEYQYLRAVVKNHNNEPIQGIPSESFIFTTIPTEDTEYYGNLSLTFLPQESETDANGEIRFKIKGDTSIQGDVSIEVSVEDVLINDQVILETNTFDRNLDGTVNIPDLGMFAVDYQGINWMSDFNWDGAVDIADLGMFASHYQHAPGRMKTGDIPKGALKQLRKSPEALGLLGLIPLAWIVKRFV
jgi:parallel beta-helix repeat protein